MSPCGSVQIPATHVLVHEVGHVIIGWLEGIDGQGIAIPRVPAGDFEGLAPWRPDLVDDKQFIRRTVAGIHSQVIHAPESFRTQEARDALAEGLIPEGRSERFKRLGPEAAADLSVARTDLALLLERVVRKNQDSLENVAKTVRYHEQIVRSKLSEDAVRKCIWETVNLVLDHIEKANVSGASWAFVTDQDFKSIFGELPRVCGIVRHE